MSGTGLYDKGQEMSEEEIANLLSDPSPEPAPQEEPDALAQFDAPKTGDGNNEFPEFAHFDAPKTRKSKTLGPDDKEELSEFFTQEGIGQIVSRGFNAFFVACGADKMEPAEANNMARIVAYYCRARLPKGAGAYQPELLLCATMIAAIAPRLGPIAEKTEPTRRRFSEWVRGLFAKRKG